MTRFVGLGRRGHEVHLFVRAAPGQDPYERIHGVHIHRIPYGRVRICSVTVENDWVLEQWGIDVLCGGMAQTGRGLGRFGWCR